MDYKKTNANEIEIIPECTPVEKVLTTIARLSYESAESSVSDFVELIDRKDNQVDFSQFVHLDSSDVLVMNCVNERQCSTKVRKTDDGRYLFDAWRYEIDRGNAETLLNKVKSTLNYSVEDPEISAEAGQSIVVDEEKPERSWIKMLLELITDLFT